MPVGAGAAGKPQETLYFYLELKNRNLFIKILLTK
jgi:hypothetical protein